MSMLQNINATVLIVFHTVKSNEMEDALLPFLNVLIQSL